MNRRTLLAAAAFAAALALPGTVSAQSKPPVKVGLLSPMTGVLTSYGKMQELVLKIAVEDVNAKGGINGSPLQLQIEDTGLDPGQASLMFRKLAGEGAFAVIGPMSGTQWETVSPLANLIEMPAVAANALKPGVTKRPWTIRMHPADDTLLPDAFAAFRQRQPGAKRVVIVADVREASSKAGADIFEKLVKDAGLQLIEVVEFSTRVTDMSPAAIKVKGHNPDAIFVAALGPSSVLLAKEFKVQGVTAPVLVSAATWPGMFVNLVGDEGANWYTMGFVTNDKAFGDDALNQSLVKRVFERADASFGKPVNVANYSVSYDSLLMLADLMRRAGIDGTMEPKKARETIKNEFMKMKGFNGINIYKMRDSGDAYVANSVLKANVQAHKWEFVK